MSEASDWSRAPASLDGAWLRKQRERIAMGRRPFAVRLGITESTLARVERQALDVPLSWLPGLAALGFSWPHSAEEPATPGTDAASEADSSTLLDEANLLRGQWLRAQRFEHTVHLHRLAKALHVRCAGLLQLERGNLLLPVAWMATLMELGLVRAGTAAAHVAALAPVQAGGRWLQRERRRRELQQAALAAALQVPLLLLGVVESCDVPVPQEWWPVLRRLGFPDARTPMVEVTLDTAPSLVSATERLAPVEIAGAPDTGRLILDFRLSFARRVGQAPLETLTRIIGDMRECGLGGETSLADVEEIAQRLLRTR
jgi:transcriptional regulator with XRE-family HTH domain